MKFLVDAQLPRTLAVLLVARGHDAVHTLDLPDANRTGDSEIGRLADAEDQDLVALVGAFAGAVFVELRTTALVVHGDRRQRP